MEVFVVWSREQGLIACTTDYDMAVINRDNQILSEEMGGGRPSVTIYPTTLIE